MRYFLWISYDGTGYHGWQAQPNGTSVEEVLERGLSTLLRREIKVTGAGRTDAGVHALRMAAHFDVDADVCPLDCEQVVYRLNKILPVDVAVQRMEAVSDESHARFSAISRTYHYYISLRKHPFAHRYACRLYGDIDFSRMNEAATLLIGRHDFTSFSKVDTDTKTNDCTVTEAIWEEVGEGMWRFTITANRFLRNMVRAVVGTLMEVGRGRLTREGLAEIMAKKDRCSAGESVPACGLFLADIKYPWQPQETQ